MTTDTVPKLAERTVAGSEARVVGMAKGSGMIEPNMATMIAVVLTDAAVDGAELQARFGEVVDHTFNCISVDTDSSTSDTAFALASGVAGPVDEDAFDAALHGVCLDLAKQVVKDGEGAEKLIEVRVDEARDPRAGEAGSEGDRQLPAGQDGGSRRRPELGPRGDGGGQVRR